MGTTVYRAGHPEMPHRVERTSLHCTIDRPRAIILRVGNGQLRGETDKTHEFACIKKNQDALTVSVIEPDLTSNLPDHVANVCGKRALVIMTQERRERRLLDSWQRRVYF